MDLNWIKPFLPVINAVGIPILVFSFVILIFSFIRSIKLYKNMIQDLNTENKTLREKYEKAEADYHQKAVDYRKFVDDTIAKLEDKKKEIESQTESKSNVDEVDRVINLLEIFKSDFQQHSNKIEGEISIIEGKFDSLTNEIGNLAFQVADTNSTITLVEILTTMDEKYEALSLSSSNSKKERKKLIKLLKKAVDENFKSRLDSNLAAAKDFIHNQLKSYIYGNFDESVSESVSTKKLMEDLTSDASLNKLSTELVEELFKPAIITMEKFRRIISHDNDYDG